MTAEELEEQDYDQDGEASWEDVEDEEGEVAEEDNSLKDSAVDQ